jgi:tetratricopeptide (TPR) repeat protein
MAGPSRLVVTAIVIGAAWVGPRLVRADDPKPKAEPAAEAPKPKNSPADFALPGEEVPGAFVPKTPRTSAEQKQVEATRLYAEARSLEDRRQLPQAITVLEKALESDPQSIAILRRLCRLCIALGRTEKSVEYSRRVLAVEPDDSETIVRLVDYYRNRKRDNAKAEALLKDVLANPKLDKSSSGALLLEFELSKLYAAMQRFDQATAPLARVIDALDGKAGLHLSPADQKRVLGVDEADAYLQFGLIFIAGKRRDLAINAFQHGLIYERDNPQLSLLLAETYLEANRGEEALALIEKDLKGPGGSKQVYDLLIQALTKLKREKEIIPRLEAAAQGDPRNGPLQYALADRYRAAGMGDKADALLKTLIETQPDLQGFVALYASLLKEKKTEDLIGLLAKVASRLRREDAVRSQIDALVADPAYTDKVIDTGLAMLSAKPPRLDRAGWFILLRIASTAKKGDKAVDLLRWSVKDTPDPIVYRELIRQLFDLGKFVEAQAEVEALMAKFPEEKNPQTMLLLGQILVRANKEDAAINVLKDVLKSVPNDPDAIRLYAFALQQKGKTDDALAMLRDALKTDPANLDLTRAMAYVFQQSGKNTEAIAYFKGLLDKFPNNDELVRFARSNLSTIYTSLGDFAKGESELEVLFAKNPDDPGVNNDLGYLYTEQGKNLEKAESMIRKAVAEEPNNSAYLDSLGWVLFKRGKAKEAVGPLEKAIQNLQAEDATVHEHLGDVYFAIKDRAKALASWEKAEKIGAAAKPPDKRLSEIRKKLESLKTLPSGPSASTGANP